MGLMVRVFGRSLALSALVACASAPGSRESSASTDPGPPPIAKEPSPPILADRGVAHGTQGVWVVATWRSEVDARGVVVVVPAEGTSAAAIGVLANRILDAGFNHAYVEASERPLATRIDVGSMLAVEKLLGHRQRMEQGRPLKPTITALWLDDRGPERALEVVRAAPPPRVQVVIVLSKASASERSAIAGPTGEIQVLEIAAPPDGPLGEAAWAEALAFLDEIERDLLGDR